MALIDQSFEDYAPQGRDPVHPRFHTMSVPDAERTKTEGRACFKEIEMVEILSPGARNSIPDLPVTEQHRQRWPRQYAAFKQGLEAPLDGTPLIEWPLISRSQAEELAAINVKTLEQLIAMPDNAKQRVMGAVALAHKAEDWLKRADGSLSELREDNDRLRSEIEVLKQTVKELGEAKAARRARNKLEQAAT